MDNKKYQAIIFDLDGTLINSIPDIADSMNRILLKHGYQEYDYDQYKYFVGNGIKRLVEICIPDKNKSERETDIIFDLMIEEYGRNCLHKTYVYDGISDLLNDLSLRNIKMAVLSNKADSITRKICDELFCSWNFEIILGATDNFPKKPDPTAALFVADKLLVSPENIFYLGDTSIDMKTASAANFFPAGASWGFRPEEELINSGAKFIAHTPSDCLRFF
ncbi:MAG: HAD family hydrolase [Prevotellaceae bacterium]|jgi:phosphoglycolate phosphatase|nr:HAD family hydrolase [Prevotellaceae bacterium]